MIYTIHSPRRFTRTDDRHHTSGYSMWIISSDFGRGKTIHRPNICYLALLDLH